MGTVLTDLQDWLAGLVRNPDFVARHPGFVHVLARLDPCLDSRVDVMGVSAFGRRFRLHVNEAFFRDQAEFLPGVLQHEIHHLVLGHVTHAKFRYAEHGDLMQLAMEMSANEYITHPLPGEAVTWQRLAKHGVEAGQSTLERYAALVKAREEGGTIEWDWCFVDDHLEEHGVGRTLSLPPHLAKRMGALRRTWGRNSHDLMARLTDPAALVHPPDWRAGLAQFASLLRTVSATWLRPNRRFPDALGLIPGRIRQTDPQGRPHLLVAIDTSGSMDESVLAAIGGELARIQRLARITVAECDKRIQRVYAFDGELASVQGRGGTDLRPPFEPAFLAQHRPDGVVYFTDGDGPYPETPASVRTLWVLTTCEPFACPWGSRLMLDPALPFARRSPLH